MLRKERLRQRPKADNKRKSITIRCRHCDEDGRRCLNERNGLSMFCVDHGPQKPRETAIAEIIQGNNVTTKYKYTLSEFKDFVEKEVQQLPAEILNCFEELSIMKAMTQYFITKLDEARKQGDERTIGIWMNRLSNHISDTVKVATRVWTMQQPSNNVPTLHVVAVLNQIQDFVRGYIPQDQLDSFETKMQQIKIGVGETNNDNEGITKDDLKSLILSVPKEEDFIDV